MFELSDYMRWMSVQDTKLCAIDRYHYSHWDAKNIGIPDYRFYYETFSSLLNSESEIMAKQILSGFNNDRSSIVWEGKETKVSNWTSDLS